MIEAINTIIERLEDYASLERSEQSEYWTALIAMDRCRDCCSEAFSKALDREIRSAVKYVDRNMEIVESVRTTEHRVRELRERE